MVSGRILAFAPCNRPPGVSLSVSGDASADGEPRDRHQELEGRRASLAAGIAGSGTRGKLEIVFAFVRCQTLMTGASGAELEALCRSFQRAQRVTPHYTPHGTWTRRPAARVISTPVGCLAARSEGFKSNWKKHLTSMDA